MNSKLNFVQMYEVADLSPFFVCIENGETFTRLMPELGYYGDRHFLFYRHGKMGTAFYEESDLKNSAQHTFDMFLKPKEFARFKSRVERIISETQAYLDRLEKINPEVMDKHAIRELIIENSRIEGDIFALFNVTQPQNFDLFEQEMRQALRSHSDQESRVNEWLSLLCTHEEPTQLSEEELDWLRLIKFAKAQGAQKESPDVSSKIKAHFDRYKLLTLGDGHWEPDISYYLQNFDIDIKKSDDAIENRIGELEGYAAATRTAKQELITRLGLSEEVVAYGGMIGEAGHLRFRLRMEGFIPLAEGRGQPIFTAAGKLYGLSTREFTQLTYREFLDERIPEAAQLKSRLTEQTYLVEVDNGSYQVYFGQAAQDRYAYLVKSPAQTQEDIRGNTAMGGKIRGRVCLFNWGDDIQKAIDDLRPDSILVAGQTRPQLMQLIRGCIGIVTDEGGVMSHSAIVARELRMPCIVGTKNATKVLRHGDLIELNADAGTVTILKRNTETHEIAPTPDKKPAVATTKTPAPARSVNINPGSLYLSFENIKADQLDLVGGKGLSLSSLTLSGVPVPPGFVITSEAWRALKGYEVPKIYQDEILSAFDELGAERVAVRSSAVAEDSADASWAGQFESFLNVTRGELIEAIESCWQSADAESVRAYAAENKISDDKLALAVVVQAMIDSEVSGVAFSINPVTKNSSEIMIEATYGLGEMLVQGMVTPDNYLIDKDNARIIAKSVQAKTKELVYKNGSNTEVDVAETKASEPCLGDSQIAELASLVKKIEHHYGTPQDIEWAFVGDKFFILQSRPITTL